MSSLECMERMLGLRQVQYKHLASLRELERVGRGRGVTGGWRGAWVYTCVCTCVNVLRRVAVEMQLQGSI